MMMMMLTPWLLLLMYKGEKIIYKESLSYQDWKSNRGGPVISAADRAKLVAGAAAGDSAAHGSSKMKQQNSIISPRGGDGGSKRVIPDMTGR